MVKKRWTHLYRAVNERGRTVDFLSNKHGDIRFNHRPDRQQQKCSGVEHQGRQRGRVSRRRDESFQLVYDGTWIKGTHSTQFGFNGRHILTRHTRNDKIVGSLASLVADVSRGSSVSIPASSRPPTCSTPVQTNCLRASDVGQSDALFAAVTGMVDSIRILTVRDGNLSPLPFGTPFPQNPPQLGWALRQSQPTARLSQLELRPLACQDDARQRENRNTLLAGLLQCFQSSNLLFSNPTLDLTNPRDFGVVTQQNVPTRRESSSRWIRFGLRLEF